MAKSIETLSSGTLVLFPGSLGDFICVLPALEQLRVTAKDHCLAVAARGQSLEIASHISWISHVYSLDRSLFASLFSTPSPIHDELGQLLSSMKQVVSWFGYSSPEVQATLERFVNGDVHVFPFFRGQEGRHACQYYLHCLGSEELRCPFLTLGEEARRWLAAYWQSRQWNASTRLLVLHPGSGGQKKRWAKEGFMHVARWWNTDTNKPVVILLGPAEEHEEALWRSVGVVEKTLPLQYVGALLSRADLYVGNDSGVSHFAGALGARGVVLFGPTSFAQWRPLGGLLTVIANTDYRYVAPDETGISLQEVPSESVIEKLVCITGAR